MSMRWFSYRRGRRGCGTGRGVEVVLVLTGRLLRRRAGGRRAAPPRRSPGGLSVGQVLVHRRGGQRPPGPVGWLGDGPPGVLVPGQPPGFRTGLDLDDVADGQRPVTE